MLATPCRRFPTTTGLRTADREGDVFEIGFLERVPGVGRRIRRHAWVRRHMRADLWEPGIPVRAKPALTMVLPTAGPLPPLRRYDDHYGFNSQRRFDPMRLATFARSAVLVFRRRSLRRL
jgi:hypothetical protein